MISLLNLLQKKLNILLKRKLVSKPRKILPTSNRKTLDVSNTYLDSNLDLYANYRPNDLLEALKGSGVNESSRKSKK